MLYPSLWAYQNAFKIDTNFYPYHLVHGVESILPIECEIPSLKLSVELLLKNSKLEERLLCLEKLNQKHRDALVAFEVNKCRVKS